MAVGKRSALQQQGMDAGAGERVQHPGDFRAARHFGNSLGQHLLAAIVQDGRWPGLAGDVVCKRLRDERGDPVESQQVREAGYVRALDGARPGDKLAAQKFTNQLLCVFHDGETHPPRAKVQCYCNDA